MATSGQTLNDRINAARYALAGQGLARCVCKATTEEVIGPKKKHLDYLLACTHEPNVSIPQLANLLIERTNHIYWVVVFKALVTVHHLMSYGNERFTQYLASSNYSFELSTFLDKTTARDFSMSTFIRRYSRYINEKALSYRLLAFDLCKVKRGSEGVLRVMPIDRLLKTSPILQNQLDALLEFDCTANDLNNGVINACFMLLFRDLIGLFACHNDGIINLLNQYFKLNKKMCREAFEHYKKFLVRMDKVSEFLRVAEAVGIDKDEIPDLRRAPSSLIDALEQHLQNLESNKKILKQQSNGNTSNGNKTANGDLSVFGNLTPPMSTSSHRSNSPSYLSSTNNANSNLDSAVPAGITSALTDEFSVASFRDDEVRRALEEEARVLSQYGGDGPKDKSSRLNSKTSTGGSSTTGGDISPKFAVATIPKTIDDIFGDADAFANGSSTATTTKPDNNNSSVFDDFNSPTLGNTNTARSKPDLNSIKSAIQSATTRLEKSNHSGPQAPTSAPKKASDELLSLLDSTPVNQVSNPMIDPLSKLAGGLFSAQPTTTSTIASAFGTICTSTTSPFDLPLNGGPQKPAATTLTALKPGNPFPDVANDYASSTSSAFPGPSIFSSISAAPMVPVTAASSQSSLASNNFKPRAVQTKPNYTNLGGLEGFGDLLQPTSAPGKQQQTTYSTNQMSSGRPTTGGFNSGSGLSSTGLFKGDLDSTLANLAQNLTFEGISKTKK